MDSDDDPDNEDIIFDNLVLDFDLIAGRGVREMGKSQWRAISANQLPHVDDCESDAWVARRAGAIGWRFLEYHKASEYAQQIWETLVELLATDVGCDQSNTGAATGFYQLTRLMRRERFTVDNLAAVMYAARTVDLDALYCLLHGFRLRGESSFPLPLLLPQHGSEPACGLDLLGEFPGFAGRRSFPVASMQGEFFDGQVLNGVADDVESWRKHETHCLTSAAAVDAAVALESDFGGDCLLLTQAAPGGSLRAFVQRECPGPSQTLLLLYRSLQCLDRLHGLGIVHGQVNPDHLLLARDHSVRLCDFSVAATSAVPGPHPDLWRRTLRYCAPEILHGAALTPQCDLYSLGITFVELCSGRNPLQQTPLTESAEARQQLVDSGLQDYPIAADLCELLLRLIAMDQRPQSASDVLQHSAFDWIRDADNLPTVPTAADRRRHDRQLEFWEFDL